MVLLEDFPFVMVTGFIYLRISPSGKGLYGSSYEYKSTGASSSGGVPGTDSNGDVTDTMITDNGDSSSETILNKYDYLPNKTVQNIEHEIGAERRMSPLLQLC